MDDASRIHADVIIYQHDVIVIFFFFDVVVFLLSEKFSQWPKFNINIITCSGVTAISV